MPPEFLVVGHVTRDLSADGYRLGGTATFGSLTALRLGLRPATVTSFADGLDVDSTLADVQVHRVPSAESTTFRNTYLQGKRTQYLGGLAGPLTPSDIPTEWRSTPMVLLGPMAGEVDLDLLEQFPDSLVVASLQGWLRQWDSSGLVSARHWDGREVLPHVNAAVVSIEDVEDPGMIDDWARIASTLIVTMGDRGAWVYARGHRRRIGPFPTVEVDPTGAGDVFAAAYLVRYHETSEPFEAALFGSCAASFAVEVEGVEGIPTRAQVEERLGGHV